jgi:hypothetical protein
MDGHKGSAAVVVSTPSTIAVFLRTHRVQFHDGRNGRCRLAGMSGALRRPESFVPKALEGGAAAAASIQGNTANIGCGTVVEYLL